MSDPSTTDMARQLLSDLDTMISHLNPEQQEALIRHRAGMDGFAVQLREAGWSPGQVGVLLFDCLVTKYHLDHAVAVAVAMDALR